MHCRLIAYIVKGRGWKVSEITCPILAPKSKRDWNLQNSCLILGLTSTTYEIHHDNSSFDKSRKIPPQRWPTKNMWEIEFFFCDLMDCTLADVPQTIWKKLDANHFHQINRMPRRLPRSRQREHSASFPTVESTSTSMPTSINPQHEYQRGSHRS